MHRSLFCFLSWAISSFCVAIASTANNSTSTCQGLLSALPGDIFFPSDPTYNASISSYPFPQLRLHPTCILRPQSAQHVSTAVKLLHKSGTKFAVRGGGHNANVGYNNIEDGVTLDMRSMNAVVIGRGEEVVSVGAGAIWQDVYDVTDRKNISVLGGRIGVVGVGGFLTGGGISFWGPEKGWACDYVVNFEVALASGDIVNANATSNSDLFAALKGGQSNFGIITRFDLKAFPAGVMWGGRIAFAPEADEALITGYTNFKLGKFDPYAAGWVTTRYTQSTGQFTPTSILWYTKPELQPGALGHMTNVTPQVMNGMTIASAGDFARNASMVVKTSNLRTIWATTTFHISPTILHSIHNKWKALIPQLLDTYAYASPASELTFQSLAPPPQQGAAPNSLGFSSTSSPQTDLVFLQIIFYFNDSGATEGLNNALKEFVGIFNGIAEQEGVANKWEYLNFAAWFQEPLKSYGEESLEKLRRVARKYDARGFFQHQLAGGFKVFNTSGIHGWQGNGIM